MLLNDNINKRLPLLCKEGECTACNTCYSLCKHQAITMLSDDKGFLYPDIETSKCIGCLVCEKKCPVLNPIPVQNKRPEKVYACWHKDIGVRMASSSGGAFSAIAEYVLENNGIVWGAAYDNELHLTYQYIDNIDDLDKLRRSKYIQSELGNAFNLIKEQLKSERLVLFTGTSCHIKGLYNYLGTHRHIDNLLTIDFICHGVPSPKVFKKYIDWIERKHNDKLIDFNFRDKRYGWDNGVLTVGHFLKQGEKKFMDNENSFFYGMLHDLFIRPCCHDCKANGLERDADFTIADFWGIGKKIAFKDEKEKPKGISLLALNSEKANKLFLNKIHRRLAFTERTLEEAYEGNWNYRYSALKNSKTPDFWIQFEKKEKWEELLYFFQPTYSERCKLFVKRYMGPVVANKLRKILGK